MPHTSQKYTKICTSLSKKSTLQPCHSTLSHLFGSLPLALLQRDKTLSQFGATQFTRDVTDSTEIQVFWGRKEALKFRQKDFFEKVLKLYFFIRHATQNVSEENHLLQYRIGRSKFKNLCLSISEHGLANHPKMFFLLSKMPHLRPRLAVQSL